MTREFHIKGLTGLAIFTGAILVLAIVLLTVPSAIVMVVWNAVVYEGFGGPTIQLTQGLLLWTMVALICKILFQPSMEINFRKTTPEELAELHSFVESKSIPDESGEAVIITGNEALAEQPVEFEHVRKR